jgi:hypothetical protein
MRIIANTARSEFVRSLFNGEEMEIVGEYQGWQLLRSEGGLEIIETPTGKAIPDYNEERFAPLRSAMFGKCRLPLGRLFES